MSLATGSSVVCMSLVPGSSVVVVSLIPGSSTIGVSMVSGSSAIDVSLVPCSSVTGVQGTNDTPMADDPVANDTPMDDKPITNDTPMTNMNETPGNKNSQDQRLIQDNSAVRTYKEDTSSTDSNGSPNTLKVTPRQKKKKKYCHKQTLFRFLSFNVIF
jgi:hypothetical protein